MYVSSYRPQGDIDTLALTIYASDARINWRKAYAMERLKLSNNKTK